MDDDAPAIRVRRSRVSVRIDTWCPVQVETDIYESPIILC